MSLKGGMVGVLLQVTQCGYLKVMGEEEAQRTQQGHFWNWNSISSVILENDGPSFSEIIIMIMVRR